MTPKNYTVRTVEFRVVREEGTAASSAELSTPEAVAQGTLSASLVHPREVGAASPLGWL